MGLGKVSDQPTILAVDNESEPLASVVRILTLARYSVKAADSGEAALEFLAADIPDMILADMHMPGINGLDLCRQLKADERTRAIPVILMSQLADVKEMVAGLTEGASDFINKPFVADELLMRVRTHLALHQAGKSMAQQAAEFRTLAEAMPQIVWITRADGWNIYFNQQWVDYTGLSLEESCGHGWNIPFHPDDQKRAWDAWQNATQHNATYSIECRLRRADGIYRWWLVRGVPLLDSKGNILKWFGTCTDIDDLKRSDAYARQQQKLEAIGTLASGVAHEINNPLNVIMNYGELLTENSTDSGKITDFSTNIIKESERIAGIVRSLLDFARQEADIASSPASIGDIVRNTLSLYGSALRKDQIAVACTIPEQLPTVLCRSQQLQQVLVNLLTNARDALNDRFPKADKDKAIRIVASTCRLDDRDWLRLTVEDYGGGIPSDVATRIFDPFFTTKGRSKGTGLGLSISQSIMHEHGGSLSFDSEPGIGTKFYMDLPINSDADHY